MTDELWTAVDHYFDASLTPADPALGIRNRQRFTQTLLGEVMPAVEREYRVTGDRITRAIA